MNIRTRTRALTAALAAALILMTAGAAKADANPANDSGYFTVRLTPNVDLGVTVDTTGAAWTGSSNLDVTMNLGVDNVLTSPVKVTMQGNFTNQELTLTGTALNTWTLNTDEVDRTDQMRLYAMLGISPSNLGAPAVPEYNGVNNLITAATRLAGQPQADETPGSDANHSFEFDTTMPEYDDVDGMGPNSVRSLWLRAKAPSTSTSDMQSAFVVTLTAVSGVGQ